VTAVTVGPSRWRRHLRLPRRHETARGKDVTNHAADLVLGHDAIST
jgi:hypothetical protein